MPLPGAKYGLHAVDKPLAFELRQHRCAADDGYTGCLSPYSSAITDDWFTGWRPAGIRPGFAGKIFRNTARREGNLPSQMLCE